VVLVPAPATGRSRAPLQRRWLLSGLAALGLGASACTGVPAQHVQLTPDGPAYQMHSSGNAVTVTNGASGGNNRELLFSPSAPDVAGGRSCATWEAGSGIAQQGIAFRIRRGADGWRAVVLERNIWLEQYWLFVPVYFHADDPQSSSAPAPVESSDGVSLAGYLGSAGGAVYPLRVCAEVRDGVLAFAVAKNGDAMVPPGTPGRGGVVPLRPELVPATGRIGSYVAHVPRGTSTTISDVTVDGRAAPVPST
jgi:hypothetical protein